MRNKFLASGNEANAKQAMRFFLEDIGEFTKSKTTDKGKTSFELFKQQHPSYADRKKTLEESYRRWKGASK